MTQAPGRPRLYFVNRYYWPDESATAQLLADLATGLAARGWEVTVVSSRQRLDDPAANLPAQEQQGGVNIHRLATSRFGRLRLLGRLVDYLSFYVGAFTFCLANLRPGDVLVAKTDPPVLGAVLYPAVKFRKARLLNWLQDVYPEIATRLGVLAEHSLPDTLLRKLRNASLRRADCNVVVGERMRDTLSRGVAGARFEVIPNWAPDLQPTTAHDPKNRYRKQLGVGDALVVCYSGNLGRAHRFESLLAAGQLLRNRSDVSFLIIGGGAQYQSVRAGAKSRALSNWHFLPYQSREHLGESLGAADVHLVSLDPPLEGYIVPSKIYGVLAAGRPTIFIGDPDGEIAVLLRKHDCGYTVAQDSPGKLEQLISKLAGDAELRERLGANARKAFTEVYRVELALEHWERVLTPPPETASATGA